MFIILAILTINSCSVINKDIRRTDMVLLEAENSTDITVMPKIKQTPAYIVFKKTTKINLAEGTLSEMIKRDFSVSSNMRNLEYFALIKKKGRVLRRIEPYKLVFDQKTRQGMSPSLLGSRLFLNIPPINPELEIEIVASFEWVDLRWMDPVLLEEPEYTKTSQLNIKIPFGIEMHFQAARKQPIDLTPVSTQIFKELWKNDPLSAGVGTNAAFSIKEDDSLDLNRDGLLQMYLSFFTTSGSENFLSSFDSWESVSKFLYERIDRLDFPSQSIVAFTKADIENEAHQKVIKIFEFLSDIQIFGGASDFKNQSVQPASRTLLKKSGSAYDVVILGKALLQSLNIPCEIMAFSDAILDHPPIKAFPTPAAFTKVLLLVKANDQEYIFDPLAPKEYLENKRSPGHALPINAAGSGLVYFEEHPFTYEEIENIRSQSVGL